MMLPDGAVERGNLTAMGLQKQEEFSTLFHASLPPVNRVDVRDDVDAGASTGVYGGFRDPPCFTQRAGGGEGQEKGAAAGHRRFLVFAKRHPVVRAFDFYDDVAFPREPSGAHQHQVSGLMDACDEL